MNLDIKGLRVLVTAGANGIGLAVARAFVREGARVDVRSASRYGYTDFGSNANRVLALLDDIDDAATPEKPEKPEKPAKPAQKVAAKPVAHPAKR